LSGIADAVGVLVAGQAALAQTVQGHDDVLAQLVAGQAEILRRLAPDA
jgi:hypothetical protein